ncbi:MAG: DUF4381 domain-containing protein [Pseudomonadota bacterium]
MNGDETAERPTNLVDLMGELIPPPDPALIPLIPQTIGWPILLVLILGATLWIMRQRRRVRRADAYRGAAIAALETAGSDPETVARILRQTALAAYPRTDVAGLFGPAWLDFLDATCAETRFRDGPGAVLSTAPYRPGEALPDATVDLVRRWVLHHNRALAP